MLLYNVIYLNVMLQAKKIEKIWGNCDFTWTKKALYSDNINTIADRRYRSSDKENTLSGTRWETRRTKIILWI